MNEYPIKASPDLKLKNPTKPCLKLNYCPYGPLVEQYPILKTRNRRSCTIFGHQCPVFYASENLKEEIIL